MPFHSFHYIHFGILLLTFKARRKHAPLYLTEVLYLYTPSDASAILIKFSLWISGILSYRAYATSSSYLPRLIFHSHAVLSNQILWVICFFPPCNLYCCNTWTILFNCYLYFCLRICKVTQGLEIVATYCTLCSGLGKHFTTWYCPELHL